MITDRFLYCLDDITTDGIEYRLPTLPGDYYSEDDMLLYFGGKAMSLFKLKNLCLRVPKAWVIPSTFSLPCVRDTGYEYDFRTIAKFYEDSWKEIPQFAVRSGSKVSMPGLMHTSLGVTFTSFEDAVKAVHESYNSENAMAYREAQNIPHTMGTAVIIQEMVKNLMFSGVCFTCDPNKPNVKEFSPVIEYVNGTGEALVGGVVTPAKLSLASPLGEALVPLVKKIHDQFGPSDIEWCSTSDCSISFVQQRALKFAEKVSSASASASASLNSNGIKLATGKSVGSPVVVSGEFIDASMVVSGTELSNKILYVHHFEPSYYMYMVKAKGIITQTGGATCHASIIARTYNKPAISGVYCQYWNNGAEITLDGSTGVIYQGSLEGSNTKTASQEKHKVIPDRMPDFRVIKGHNTNWFSKYMVNHILYRVYFLVDKLHKGELSQELFDKAIKEVAKLFCTYFYIAALCEMRWVYRSGCRGNDSYQSRNAAEILKKYKYNIPRDNETKYAASLGDRDKWAITRISQPNTITRAIKMMQHCVNGFNSGTWSSSYGGCKWGDIANTVLLYLTGHLTDLLFVDLCFNLEHNGGSAFDKFSWISCERSNLKRQLDYKASGDISLVKDLCNLNAATEDSYQSPSWSLFNDAVNSEPVVKWLKAVLRERKKERVAKINQKQPVVVSAVLQATQQAPKPKYELLEVTSPAVPTCLDTAIASKVAQLTAIASKVTQLHGKTTFSLGCTPGVPDGKTQTQKQTQEIPAEESSGAPALLPTSTGLHVRAIHV